jgi:tetratricopeptide (TPR) repeat protein
LFNEVEMNEEAKPLLQTALAIRKKALGTHPLVGETLDRLAAILLNEGSLEECLSCCQQAGEIWEKESGPDHTDVAETLNVEATCLVQMDDVERAVPLFERALGIFLRAEGVGSEHPLYANVLNSLGVCNSRQGHFNIALERCEKALAIRRKVLPTGHVEVCATLENVASLLTELGREKEAERVAFEAQSLTALRTRQEDAMNAASAESAAA